jgi:tRNA pseudouridine55 synthase
MDGVVVVDKPAGPTSHDMVDRVRRALGVRRVGHTGTLDPFATGVLPLCVGKATRLARFLSAGDKEYQARLRFGFATTTDDLTGEPLSAPSARRPPRSEVERALAGFVGRFSQVPPAFSARRVGGRRLYERARRGEAGPRPATLVTVRAIEVLDLVGDTLELRVRCSPGTYLRALARDLGEKLGVGAHLTALRRTRSGSFDLQMAVAADALAEAERRMVPMEALLPELPAVRVPASTLPLLRNGRDLDAGAVAGGFPAEAVERVRLVGERGELLALAVARGFGEAGELPRTPVLHPDVVLVD